MQVLLLLATTIVARSQCAQWVLQQRGQNDNVMAGDDKELKSAAQQALLGFKHAPSYEWVPATRTSSVFSDLLDNADNEVDHSVGQQVLQSASEESENELQSRLLQLYQLMPTQTSKWRNRRRRQDEEVQPGTGTAGLPRLCHDAERDCSDSSSSATLPEAHVERESDLTPPRDHLHGQRREDGEKTACGHEESCSDGRMKRQADGEQTADGEDPQTDYAFNRFGASSWGGKRATPFTVVGKAWRRTFNSWGGKRNPSFHSWGGKRSNPFAVLGNSRSWGAMTDPSLGSEKEPAFTLVGSSRQVPAFPSITDEPTVAVLSSKIKPAPRTLRTKRDTALVILDGKSNPALGIPNNHNPKLAILETADRTTPVYGKRYRAFNSWGGKRGSVFSSWGGKRDDETPDLEDQATFFKRGPQFSSWDGNTYSDDDTQEKRAFSSWGGKRNLIPADVPELTDEMGKRIYSSWGGKRYTTKTEPNLQNSPITKNFEAEHGPWLSDKERRNASIQTSLVEAYQQLLKYVDCRMQFRCEDNDRRKGNSEQEARPGIETSLTAAEDQNNRSSELHGRNAEHEVLGTVMKRSDSTPNSGTRVSKAQFRPWGGKRSQVLPPLVSILGIMHRVDGLLNKRASTQYESLGSKKWGQSPSSAVFSSWGGKRSMKLSEHNIHNAPIQSSGRQLRRAAEFYSWAGKR